LQVKLNKLPSKLRKLHIGSLVSEFMNIKDSSYNQNFSTVIMLLTQLSTQANNRTNLLTFIA
jgi:hypothetical protein